ncbi:Restriction endonuclease NaeI [Geodermatophilus saharensis]|uniref:Restriction endonuclease NaeI n=1 Tax=Geodermatophilus saharensis TaxID=1137994 RepID=A0A239EGM9_9ACTN|nr:NaeI family type II restriction endonuclease [Geodermatophilus saharensis]SNS43428.1 Restriction endonuclease NaeI [Geodermatophilus saharensis]
MQDSIWPRDQLGIEYEPMAEHGSGDAGLSLVRRELEELDPDGDRFAAVLRDTLDQLLDGRRRGRFDYRDLYKTEKTYMGTLVEINLQRAFDFEDGDVTDYSIVDVDVDCKFSQRIGGWELGPEMLDQLCLVVWCSDRESSWRAGLVRASADVLRETTNRDAKRRLNDLGMSRIQWLWPDHGRLAENLLLHLNPEVRDRIMSATGRTRRANPVQARVNQLFREVQGRIIRRSVLETVAHGADDPLKRARGNGGARDKLRPEGILVLGHQDNDPVVAEALGLPRPRKGEFVAARVVEIDGPTSSRPAAEISGRYYAIALPGDEAQEGPEVSRQPPTPAIS